MKIIKTSQVQVSQMIEEMKRLVPNLSADYLAHLLKSPPEKVQQQLEYYRKRTIQGTPEYEEAQRELRYQQPQAVQANVPPEIAELEPEPASGNYTRYIWGTKSQVAAEIKNGIQLNTGHSGLPQGWNYTHAGDEEWVAVVGFDYGRSGPAIEVEIFNLPEGFYAINDIDLTYPDKSPSSLMIISKQTVIPPQCLKIGRQFSTEKMMKQHSQYGDDHYYEWA